MTTSNHLFAGAIVALTVQQPALAAPLAVMSHFVLDALPHYGLYRGGFDTLVKHRTTFAMESLNLIGIPLFMYVLWDESWWVWIVALLAVAPDFTWIYRYLRYERKGMDPPDGRLTTFHRKIQWGERKWGILVEVPVFILLAWTVTVLN